MTPDRPLGLRVEFHAVRPVRIVPHTHWDREWYLTVEEFRGPLVETIDLVLEIMRDPRWTHFHLDGQTALVDDYLAVRPEREPELRNLIAAGRLSCGPWVTLVDEFLVSGESIIRNLEDGIARADELGGAMRIGYLPDQFGHIGQMPQILARAGITTAVVWRGVPSSLGATSFVWSAPDDSNVRAFYLPLGYGHGKKFPVETKAFTARLIKEEARLTPFLGSAEAALMMAGADHERPDGRLVDAIDNARASGLDVGMTSLASLLATEEAPGSEWSGELRSAARANLLPNTYSVRVHQKVARARAEHLLERYAEPLASLVPGHPWPAEELAEAWRLLHLNGAHDSVCGCSIDAVAAAVDARSEKGTAIARAVAERAVKDLAKMPGRAGTLVFNPSPFERDGIPGLGWVVGAHEQGHTPVEPRVEGDAIVLSADGVDLRLALEDQGDSGDLYTFCPEGAPQRPNALEVRSGVAHASFDGFAATVRAWRSPGEPFVQVEVDLDNRAPDHRVRAILQLPEHAHMTTAGSPFEIVSRPRAGEGGESEPPPTAWPARGFVVAGGSGFLAEGVVEYELLDGDRLALTLLRCVGTVSRGPIATRKVVAGPDVPTPGAQMIGTHKIAFGILTSDPGKGIVNTWERYALPFMTAAAPGGGPLGERGVLLDVDVPALSSVRVNHGRVEVRVWNPWGRATSARVADKRVDLRPFGIETVAL
jgi:hypothetical protein